jgi:hypothetical protein
MAEEKPRIDETVSGGAYIVNGRVVNAVGVELPGWTIQDGIAVPPDKPKVKAKAEAKAEE